MIPFIIYDNVHAFLGLFPDSSIDSKKMKELFPCYHPSKPQVFLDIPYEMGFMSSPSLVLCVALYVKQNVYSEWLDKVEAKRPSFGTIRVYMN